MSSETENQELECPILESEEPVKEELITPTEETENKAQPTTAHLTTSVPRAVAVPRGAMSKTQLREARELFPDLTDGEIHRLYKKVTN